MIRRVKSGFTIVELVIAVAISVVLVSVGVPRYNSFVQRQDFIGTSQRLVTCIQTAQRAAIAPSAADSSIRYTQMTLSHSVGDNTYGCKVESWDAGNPPNCDFVNTNNCITIPQYKQNLYQDVGWDKMDVNGVLLDGGTQELNFPFRVVFGVLENGAPLLLYSNNMPLTPAANFPGNPGFQLQFSLGSRELPGTSAQVVMQRLGAPVQLTVQSGL